MRKAAQERQLHVEVVGAPPFLKNIWNSVNNWASQNRATASISRSGMINAPIFALFIAAGTFPTESTSSSALEAV